MAASKAKDGSAPRFGVTSIGSSSTSTASRNSGLSGIHFDRRRKTVFFAISFQSVTHGPELPARERLRTLSISSRDITSALTVPSLSFTSANAA